MGKGKGKGKGNGKGKMMAKKCGEGEMVCRVGVEMGEEKFFDAKCFPADTCKTENILKELRAAIEDDHEDHEEGEEGEEPEDPPTITLFQCGSDDPLVGKLPQKEEGADQEGDEATERLLNVPPPDTS